MQNPECATQCSNDQFSVLSNARSMFYLSVLEATYIKIRKPILCRQKEFVYFLQIFTNRDVACQQWQRCTVAPLVGVRTTFEIQPISIHSFIIIHYLLVFSNVNTTTFSFILFQR